MQPSFPHRWKYGCPFTSLHYTLNSLAELIIVPPYLNNFISCSLHLPFPRENAKKRTNSMLNRNARRRRRATAEYSCRRRWCGPMLRAAPGLYELVKNRAVKHNKLLARAHARRPPECKWNKCLWAQPLSSSEQASFRRQVCARGFLLFFLSFFLLCLSAGWSFLFIEVDRCVQDGSARGSSGEGFHDSLF